MSCQRKDFSVQDIVPKAMLVRHLRHRRCVEGIAIESGMIERVAPEFLYK